MSGPSPASPCTAARSASAWRASASSGADPKAAIRLMPASASAGRSARPAAPAPARMMRSRSSTTSRIVSPRCAASARRRRPRRVGSVAIGRAGSEGVADAAHGPEVVVAIAARAAWSAASSTWTSTVRASPSKSKPQIRVEQLLAGEDALRMRRQVGEQVELLGGQSQRLPGEGRLAVRRGRSPALAGPHLVAPLLVGAARRWRRSTDSMRASSSGRLNGLVM